MSDNGWIFIAAGDPSADFPGKNLIDEIRRDCPDIGLFGLGGPLMQQAGLKPIADCRDLAVMGFFEVVPKLFFFRRLMVRTVGMIAERRPKAVILMDYPGFNLRLAKRIKPLGIPIIYYISPQVWAWGKGRVAAIKRLIDLMLVIFPFEEKFFREHGIEAHFVGHPLVDRYRDIPDKTSCRAKLGYGGSERIIAILPGSRIQEIRRMLPVMTGAADIIVNKLRDVRLMLAAVPGIDIEIYRKIIGPRKIDIRAGVTPEMLSASDLVVTSSGTATVEAAYFGTPMIVVYKTGFATYQIARRLVSVDSIGMVNIIAGRKIVPELIQSAATAETIATQALQLLQDKTRYDTMVHGLMSVREALGSGNAGRNAWAAIQERVRLC
ncbi:MAG: lipid-A-disaccharide synthase [candidate division Zixibacteria bacterium]|nr:lipid-A-disaccharide synthase [candidate division Zixibacteria bacterium]